jgi:hypothetical protein
MRIGLSQRIFQKDKRTYDATDHGWYTLLAGHNLFFLPNTPNQDFNVIADNIDSFIITDDERSELRENIELTLIAKMTERDKPVVGICQGALRIAERLGSSIHAIPKHKNIDHYIMYHGEAIKVPSDHEYGITKLHDTGQILCLADTGEIEAFVDKNLAGIVWNPERMETPWIPPEIALMLRI